jgi:hypothetical protein
MWKHAPNAPEEFKLIKKSAVEELQASIGRTGLFEISSERLTLQL